MEKLNSYRGMFGRLHEWRDNAKEVCAQFKDHCCPDFSSLRDKIEKKILKGNTCASDDFSHLYRMKTRSELLRISSAVMGIEFSYAAETSFVSPILLQIGVDHQHMTLVWAISAFIGFFLCPVFGSMSDRCKLNMGRRRPFILLFSVGIILGLLLVPNGEALGYFLGDEKKPIGPIVHADIGNETLSSTPSEPFNGTPVKDSPSFGIFFTIFGTVLLDFNADACQSPSRAFLLDICIPEDHARGLSTFTIMAGLGGFLGYFGGSCDWDSTWIGQLFGGHVRAIFTLTSFIYCTLVIITLSSFKEMPLWASSHLKRNEVETKQPKMDIPATEDYFQRSCDLQINFLIESQEQDINQDISKQAGTIISSDERTQWSSTHEDYESSLKMPNQPEIHQEDDSIETLAHYLLSIINMPSSLRMVCLTNLFCWMAHVCYSLYFTDFVGEAVFAGDPKALIGSKKLLDYEEGVRFGCYGMSMYSLSCAVYSLVIEKMIQAFRAKIVYVGGLCFYCTGMILMALTRTKMSVIVFSWAAGVLYSSLFTMPYLLVAHYHSIETFEMDTSGNAITGTSNRGLGTDVAIVSSMVFLAQFSLSLFMGTIIFWSGTTTSVVVMAAFLSFCAAICATKIMYLDL